MTGQLVTPCGLFRKCKVHKDAQFVRRLEASSNSGAKHVRYKIDYLLGSLFAWARSYSAGTHVLLVRQSETKQLIEHQEQQIPPPAMTQEDPLPKTCGYHMRPEMNFVIKIHEQ